MPPTLNPFPSPYIISPFAVLKEPLFIAEHPSNVTTPSAAYKSYPSSEFPSDTHLINLLPSPEPSLTANPSAFSPLS